MFGTEMASQTTDWTPIALLLVFVGLLIVAVLGMVGLVVRGRFLSRAVGLALLSLVTAGLAWTAISLFIAAGHNGAVTAI
jgi:hypothetical protein